MRQLLPAVGAPYADNALSAEETAALEAALGDGFGDVGAVGSEPVPLPTEIDTGLLKHSFHVRGASGHDLEDLHEEFWDESQPEGKPGPFDAVPLHFVVRRLKTYFENQRDRFAHVLVVEQQTDELGSITSWERPALGDYPLLADLARYRLYEKPWYEFHALELLNSIGMLIETLQKMEKSGGLLLLALAGLSGRLGRLIEQYYWRLKFEGAAKTGQRARQGASAGGLARAAQHRDAHAAIWQRLATQIWNRRPELSKIAVATAVKKHLRDSRSAKHIARFIGQP